MSNQAAATSQRSLQHWLAWSVLTVSAAWLILTGALWLSTGKRVPLINVRWAPSVSIDQRIQAERELSLELRQPTAERTGTCYVTRPDEETLERIVLHPLVEDTAYVSRSAFVLENAPYARWWIGDRWTVLKQPGLLFAAVVGALAAAAVLFLPRHR